MHILITNRDPVIELVMCPRTQREAGVAHVPWDEVYLVDCFLPVHWWVGGTGLAMMTVSVLWRVFG